MSRQGIIRPSLREIGLWILCNAVCMGLPLLAVFGALHLGRGEHLLKVGAVMGTAAVLTATWGSWAAQLWTKSHVLRLSMRWVTLLPGLLLVGAAGLGAYLNALGLIVWAALGATGVSTMVVAWLLGRRVSRARASTTGASRLTGLLVVPVGSTLASGAVALLWSHLLCSGRTYLDLGWLFELRTYAVTTMAVVLVTTIVPASMALMSQRIWRGVKRADS